MLKRLAVAGAVAVAAATAAGCGDKKEAATSAVTTTAASETTAAATATAPTAAATGATETAAGSTSTPNQASPKAAYEQAMQARFSLTTPQCFSDDPATAQRQRIALYARADSELRSIHPPPQVAAAHGQLLAAADLELRSQRKLLPR